MFRTRHSLSPWVVSTGLLSMFFCKDTSDYMNVKVNGKGHPITGYQGPEGGVKV
jgi:hypothetical protein